MTAGIYRVTLFSIVALLAGSSAIADVTVCQGASCTIVGSSGARQMTDAEVRRKRRDEARNHLYSVECEVSDDLGACQRAVFAVARLLQ